MNPIERAIAGALKQTIDAHGPVTLDLIPSATKRIVGNLKNVGGSHEHDGTGTD